MTVAGTGTEEREKGKENDGNCDCYWLPSRSFVRSLTRLPVCLFAGPHALLFDGRFCADIATTTYTHAANKNKKESDDSTSDEGIRKRWQQQQLAERRLGRLGSSKEQRWSHVKISFDNESVRLEAADPTAAVAQLQPLPQQQQQQQQPPPPPTVVPPTIKIIGKEVTIEREREWERKYSYKILHSTNCNCHLLRASVRTSKWMRTSISWTTHSRFVCRRIKLPRLDRSSLGEMSQHNVICTFYPLRFFVCVP